MAFFPSLRSGRLAGWTTGVHLNEAGQKQAQALAERLSRAPITAVYSSPLVRALETARPLAKAKGLKAQICEELGEVRYGEWTGKSLKRLARTKLWRVVQQQPSAMEFPEGETFRAVQARAVEAVETIAHTPAKDKGLVAAVSHGDVIKLIVAYYLGMPLDLFQRIAISTASVTALRLGHGHPTLVKLNETFPLDQR